MFGEDIEPEEKYEKSIAKTRRDTQITFVPSSPPKEDYSAETDEYLKYLEEQEKDCKKFSDEIYFQAGNNSKSLKNELRQIIYSLYRSKVLTKTVYNNLIKVIA